MTAVGERCELRAPYGALRKEGETPVANGARGKIVAAAMMGAVLVKFDDHVRPRWVPGHWLAAVPA
jgi:hypothetical protein